MLQCEIERCGESRDHEIDFSSCKFLPQQFDLLEPNRREKLERLAQATDRLRDKFGFSKLQYGGSLPARDDRK